LASNLELYCGKTSISAEVFFAAIKVFCSTVKEAPKIIEAITLSDSDDEDEMATDQLAGELSKNIRPNDPRLR
jgi:hypothetical protein